MRRAELETSRKSSRAISLANRRYLVWMMYVRKESGRFLQERHVARLGNGNTVEKGRIYAYEL